MRVAFLVLAAIAGIGSAGAQGLYNSNGNRGSSFGNSGLSGTGSNPSGHYVQPSYGAYGSGSSNSGHYQSNPNNTQMDNWSTRGNVNPHTGAVGTRSPKY